MDQGLCGLHYIATTLTQWNQHEIAQDLGLGPGMALADARALVPDLETAPYDPVADRALLEQLADWCDRYSPSVALDPPNGIILDLTGCLHLWGDARDLLSDLTPRLALQGFTCRIAFAETPDKARALARHGQELLAINRRIEPGMLNEERVPYLAPPLQGRGWGGEVGQSSILQDKHSTPAPHPNPVGTHDSVRGTESPTPEGEGLHLPIASLDPQDAQATALRRAGLYTLTDLIERPRTLLAARFGEGMTDKLARVLGEEDVRIVPRRTPPTLFALHRFAEPIAHSDYVLEIIAELAREIEQGLSERGEGARHFTVSLFRSDGDTRHLSVETGSATRDPALLIRLLRERIDTLSDPLDPGFGYDAIRLDVVGTEKLSVTQRDFDGAQAEGESVALLLDRLGVRLGQARVRGFVAGNSHVPEVAGFTYPAASPRPFDCLAGAQDKLPRRGRPGPINTGLPGLDANSPKPVSMGPGLRRGDTGTADGDAPTRPLHLFDPPQRVEVIAEVPDGPPRRFRWRRVTHDVVAQEGPERIAAEWWRKKRGHEAGQGGATRDYYRVEDTQGRRFWLFRHGLYGQEKPNPDWYLHGTFA